MPHPGHKLVKPKKPPHPRKPSKPASPKGVKFGPEQSRQAEKDKAASYRAISKKRESEWWWRPGGADARRRQLLREQRARAGEIYKRTGQRTYETSQRIRDYIKTGQRTHLPASWK